MIHEQMYQRGTADDIISRLDAPQRERLSRVTNATVYVEGQLFHSPDERGEQLFLLLEGRVRIYKLSPEGRALTLAILEPVSLFGEMSLVGQRLHESFAEAMSDCVVGVIGRESLCHVLETCPQLTLCVMDLMGKRLRELEDKLADIAFKSVPERLATVLLDMASAVTQMQANVPPHLMRYTHQQFAELIGSYRETVTKAIGEFRENGLIRIEDNAIYLTNVEKLQQLANR